ncbi:MAG TPA: transposase [Xanthobacteraceae bacterium]|nr:transposase [Xanthobacteraceae bacterium]
MARLPRIIVPGLAHYVTQRGNRGQPIFFEQSDYGLYRDLVAEHCRRAAVDIWAYCLMPDHVHLVVVPTIGEGLARAIGEAHRKYSAFVNARARCSGHLFQARFASVVMDVDHALAAIGHVARNPVRTGLAARPEHWPWSSARAHLAGRDDGLVCVAPLIRRIGRFSDLLAAEPDPAAVARLKAAQTIGRPVGSDDFIALLEQQLGRSLRPQKPGRKAKPQSPSPFVGLSTSLRVTLETTPGQRVA